MKNYTLIIVSPTSPSYFFSNYMEEIKALICFGDNYIIINNYTGETEDNYLVTLKEKI